MPRKKVMPITGTGKNPERNLIVQKSHPLMELSRSELTLPEFKLLDMYLARIDSHHPEKRVVVLEKGQIEQALKVTKISADDLASRLIHLGQGVKIPDPTKKCGFRIIWLLEEVKCELDDNGLWRVTLEASSKAMKYFFNVEDLGYFRYKLRCVSGLTSRYSYILFLYLEENRFRESWKIELGSLKQILNCDRDESYSQFKVFNDRILKRCYKELNEKTECHYSYEPIKKGRSVVAIRFTVETLPKLEPPVDPNQVSIDDYVELANSDDMALLREAVKGEFTPAELEEIFQKLAAAPEIPDPAGDGQSIRRYHLVSQTYAKLQAAAARNAQKGKEIRDRYKYFLKLLDEQLQAF